MTQIAPVDLGALAANRQAASAQGASRGRGDFMAAFRHAEARKQERSQDADRADAARNERDQDTTQQDAVEATRSERANEHARADKADKADKAHKADDAQAQASDKAPKAEHAPKAEQAQATKAPAAKAADEAPVDAPVSDAPVAEAPVAEQPVAEAPIAMDAQTVLALQIATGGQLMQPAVIAQATEATAVPAAEATVQQTAAIAPAAEQAPTPEADQATQQAIAQAAQQARTEAKGQTKTQAQANGLAHAQATQHANPNAQAQSPAFLAQAARELGPITVQMSKVEAPTQPVVAVPTAEGQTVETANLAIQLLDAKTLEAAKGPNAPVTLLDGADGTETPSQLVATHEGDDEAALPALAEGEAPLVPLLNGERGVTEAAKPQAAKESEAPVRSEDVLPQLTRHMEQIKANQANAIKLQLYPEHLGKMEIRVVSHNGVISAQLSADSASVKSMLDNQVAALQRTFAEMGLKVDKVEVTLSSANLGSDSYGQAAAQQGEQQQFGRQHQPTASSSLQGSGYEQWLGDEPDGEIAYAPTDASAAVNYMA